MNTTAPIFVRIFCKSGIRHAEHGELELTLFRDGNTVCVITGLISGLVLVYAAVTVTQCLLGPLIFNFRLIIVNINAFHLVNKTGAYKGIVIY